MRLHQNHPVGPFSLRSVKGCCGSPASSPPACPFNVRPGATVVVSAFVGSALESYLGATLERVDAIDNEVVNFARTLAGGLVAVGIWALL